MTPLFFYQKGKDEKLSDPSDIEKYPFKKRGRGVTEKHRQDNHNSKTVIDGQDVAINIINLI